LVPAKWPVRQIDAAPVLEFSRVSRHSIVVLSLIGWMVPAAAAEPVQLRMASIAPDGTVWAQELKDFAREIEAGTHGELRIKWYLGGVAGDELATLERLRAGQLDGSTGTELCQRLAPTLRAVSLFGLFRDHDEEAYVLNRVRKRIDEEMHKSGFVDLGVTGFGSMIIFSRHPVRSLADLRQGAYWVWDIDPVWRLMPPELGMHAVPLSVGEGAHAYENGRTDGFMSVPSIALGLQWSAMVRYYSNLPVRFLPACFVLAERALDPLPVEQQQLLRAAAARLMVRFAETARLQNAQLLGGLLEHQGLHRVAVAPTFANEFFAAAAAARERLGDRLVPSATLQRVLNLLAEFRAERAAELRAKHP
jgi:TRAP-type C4-dicarboxylate transport system substrate-binding protein